MKDRYRQKSNAVANKESIVCQEHVRFTILTSGLIRIEYSPDCTFIDSPTQRVLYRDFPVQEYTYHIEADMLEIRTERLVLHQSLKEKSLQTLEIIVRQDKDTDYTSCWHYGDEIETLKGTTRTLDNIDGSTRLDEGILSRNGFALIDDSDSYLIAEDGELTSRKKGNIDLYFFGYGHSYRECLKDFFHLTGRPPLLPRYALGNWWSRYHKYTQEEYQNLIREFHNRQIPLAIAVIDMDWHITEVEQKYQSGWTGYTWNRTLFPKPEEFLQWLHSQGLSVSLNVHPALGVRAYEEAYPAMAVALHRDPDRGETIEFDAADSEFMEAYFQYLHKPLEDMGVDFWWIDWQQGQNCKKPGLDPLWVLNHYHFLDNQTEKKRALILSRYADVGSHRYPVGFSGDSIISWESLDFQPYFTATASNVGYCWWSHDIGGHMLGTYDEELQVRWVQFGVFSPIFRLHCSASEFNHKEPWNYSIEADQIIARFMRLRHQLIPYLYTMNRLLYQNGLPLIQPMYYEYASKEEAYHVPNEYLFGSEMICHPITTPQISFLRLGRVKTWLPEGIYIDYFTGLIYQGGRFMNLYRRMDQCPVLLKAGAIVPLAVLSDSLNDTSNPLALEVIVAAGTDGSFKLYEDDGTTMEYEDNHYATTLFHLNYEDGQFEIHAAEGCKELISSDRTYRLRFLGFDQPGIITGVAGDEEFIVEYQYDENRNEIIMDPISIPTGVQLHLQFTKMKLAENNTVERCFDLLNYTKMDFLDKEKLYDIVKNSSTGRIISRLLAEGIDEELIGALGEIILSKE